MTTIKKWADRLSPAFVSRMARQPVPWGPLGYVTYKRCVDVDTPVLCDDLVWRKAGELKVGQGLIGFDEEYVKSGKRQWRYIRAGEVTHNVIEEAETMGIELEDGTVLYATPDHSWLVKMAGNRCVWRETKDLWTNKKGGDIYLMRPFGRVWETDTTHSGGYLAAAFDGEGNIDRLNGACFVQVQNAMMERVEGYLVDRGYKFDKKLRCAVEGRQKCYGLRITGVKNLFRLFGQLQPVRIMARLQEYLKGGKKLPALRCDPDDLVKVVRVFPAGVRKIAVMSTSTKTHFTGGFASHNTYARLREDLGRTEEYHSTVERSVNAILEYGGRFTTSEAELLYEYIYTLKCSPPGRMFWQLGTPTVARIGGASCCNCFYINVSDLESFCFTFDMLMLGGGVGFGVSPADVFTLPKVLGPVKVVRRDSNDVDFIVPDNREGWVELLRRVLHAYFITGRSFTYSVHCVRGKGERIKGFGGVASGPGELVKGMSQICGVLDARVGKKIRPVDALDVMNIIGSIVVSGNVRRSAQIAVGSPKDIDYLQAKMWSRGSIPNWRNNSNNTVRADDVSELGESFWDGYSVDENGNAKGENYGLFNLALSRSHGRLIDGAGYRPDHKADGPNPCVTADTWVLTQDGPKQVSDLIGKPFVATVDGQSYPSTDRGFYATGTKPVFRVRTAGGYEFKATDNHQVLTVSKLTSKVRQTEWKTVGELKPGDRLALHNHRGNEFSGAGTFDQGWLVGNLLGDGTFCEHKGRLTAKLCYWGEHRSSMLEQARRMIRESVGARADCGTQGGDTVLDTQRKQRVLGSRKLMSLAARFGVGRDKVVGVAAEKSSSVFHRGFLQGWFDADGMIIGDQQKGVSARLTSIHLPNLQAAQRMLARLGVISTIYTGRQKAGSRPLPDGRGGMAMYECQESHELVVARDNLALFAELVGFSDPSKKAKLEQLVGGYKRALNRERFTAVVETVEPAGDESVYDCTVPGPSCFDGNGVVLHNCAEQTLEDGECCDLYELYLPRLKTREEFVTAARFGYKVCKTVLQLPFAWTKTQEVVLRNQRMGIGVSGYCEAGHFDKDDYTAAYRAVEELDVDYSREIKANRSIKLTTVKPSGCRPADALTTTSAGILTLGEMLAAHDAADEWCEYAGGDAVLDGKQSRITKTYRNGVAPVFEVHLSYGMVVRSTAEHRWFVRYNAGGGPHGGARPVDDWVRTDSLRANDVMQMRLGAYRNESPFPLSAENNRRPIQAGDLRVPDQMTDRLAWLLGYLWGNGCQSEARCRLRFTSGHVETLEKVRECLLSEFGLSAEIHPCSDREAFTVEVGSVRLWDWMSDNGLMKYDTDGQVNLIPLAVRKSSWRHVVAFLSGLIDADGCASFNREGQKKGLILSTRHDHLSEHVQHVAAAVGLLFGRSLNTKGGNWQPNGKHMWLMSLSQHVMSDSFAEMRRHSVKVAALDARHPGVGWNHEVVGRRSAFIPGKVTSVVPAGACETFDVEVEHDHWYYAGAVKSHNTVSLLPGVTPGVHPAYSRYYIRRIRFSADDPIVAACRKNGYHVEPKVEFDGSQDHSTQIVSFPVDVGPDTVTASQVSATKQMDMQRFLQTYWSDNAVSVTVYYRDEELPAIREKLTAEYRNGIKTISFTKHSNHGYRQAPYEEISRQQYDELNARCRPITGLDDAQQWDIVDSLECAGGACPVR